MIKIRQAPALSPSADWQHGYWLGIAIGVTIGGCLGLVAGLLLGAV